MAYLEPFDPVGLGLRKSRSQSSMILKRVASNLSASYEEEYRGHTQERAPEYHEETFQVPHQRGHGHEGGHEEHEGHEEHHGHGGHHHGGTITNAKDAMVMYVSALYGKLIVVIGTGFPIAMGLSPDLPLIYYNSFYLYLYFGSILFVIYSYVSLLSSFTAQLSKFNYYFKKLKKMYLNPLMDSFRKIHSDFMNLFKKPKNNNNATPEEHPEAYKPDYRCSVVSVEMQGMDDLPEEKQKFVYTEDAGHGSMYLKAGTIVFGIGSMIYSGLEFGHYFELKKSCSDILMAVTPASRMVFTFLQMYFIFLNSRVSISRHTAVARFGLMHMVATNLCIWLNVLVEETKHTIHQVTHDDSGGPGGHGAASAGGHGATSAGGHAEASHGSAGGHGEASHGAGGQGGDSHGAGGHGENSHGSGGQGGDSHVAGGHGEASHGGAGELDGHGVEMHGSDGHGTPTDNGAENHGGHDTPGSQHVASNPSDDLPHFSDHEDSDESEDLDDDDDDDLTEDEHGLHSIPVESIFNHENITVDPDLLLGGGETHDLLFPIVEETFASYNGTLFDNLDFFNMTSAITTTLLPDEFSGKNHDGMFDTEGGFHNLVRRSVDDAEGCRVVNLMGDMVNSSASFLYPCTIEYSLLCASVLYAMWKNVITDPKKESTQNTQEQQLSQLIARKVRHLYSVDCGRASRGLFSGIFILVLTLISLIIFYVLVSNPRFKFYGLLSANISEILIYSVGIVTVLIGMYQVRKLGFIYEEEAELDNVLLVIAQVGVYMFTIFTLIGGYFSAEMSTLPLISALLTLIQATLQTLYILDGSQRCCKTPDQLDKKYGRELVTFMLILNLAMWLFSTFQTSRPYLHKAQQQFYGIWAWTIINHVSTPLAIFFRFHATVCLGEIWKKAYKIRSEE